MATETTNKATDHAKRFCAFVDAGPSPFHCVATVANRLEEAGFTALHETSSDWKIQPGGRYYFTRNQSSIIAFAVGEHFVPGNGFTMFGAHTDSPCLVLKPKSNLTKNGYQMVGVQTYGGGLWHTWFDRDLSVAGRVIVKSESGFQSRLVRLNKPILRISNLAIHLQSREERTSFKFNNEDNLIPLLCSEAENKLNETKDDEAKHPPKLVAMLAEELGVRPENIQDFELCLYDTQKASIGGAYDEFVNTARIDNQASCYILSEAFVNSLDTLPNEKNVRLIAFFDDEEVGSVSANGAKSAIMRQTLQRISGNNQQLLNTGIAKSILVSVDCAHGLHPSYASRHECKHKPNLNEGLAIKHNANQRYATNMLTVFHVRQVSERYKLPIQEFVVKNDSPCGSTIGPGLSAELGVRTFDCGITQFSMHSIREVCGSKDFAPTIQLFTHYFNDFVELDESLSMEPSGLNSNLMDVEN